MLACMCCACAGKTCLELGAGAGLLGVALARLGVRELLLTDGDQTTLGNLRHNLRLNGVCESDVRTRAARSGHAQAKSLHAHGCAKFVRHHDVSLSNSSCCPLLLVNTGCESGEAGLEQRLLPASRHRPGI